MLHLLCEHPRAIRLSLLGRPRYFQRGQACFLGPRRE